MTFDPYHSTTPPAIDLSASNRDPINAERVWVFIDAATVNYMYALDFAIYQPFRAAFGADMPCGEYAMHAATQDHQVLVSPIRRRHMLGTDLPIQRQCVQNYSGPPTLRANDQPALYAQSLGWETAWNWLQVFQPAGFEPWSTYPTTPSPGVNTLAMLRLMLHTQTLAARNAAYASPNKPLMPVISAYYADSEADVDALVPFMARYMVNTVDLGAREFWLWAPDWNTGTPSHAPVISAAFIRERNFKLIKHFNGRMIARTTPRNRIRRFVA